MRTLAPAIIAALFLAGCMAGAIAATTDNDGVNEGETYFAFGDSIVSADANEGSGLLPDGKDSFIDWYRNLYDPLASVDHSFKGSGQGCLWATAHRSLYIQVAHKSQVYVLAFGNNDPRPSRGNLTPEQSASCQANLYNLTAAIRTTTVWANLSPMTADCNATAALGADAYDVGLDAQRARAEAVQRAADAMGVRIWNRYDAIDIHPGNGILDPADPSLVYDCIHPNRDGHIRLAQSLHDFLGGTP